MKKQVINIIAGSVLIIAGQSCTKQFEELNTDPNHPVVAPTTNVLAYAIEDFGAHLYDAWGDMNEPETYAGHLGKIQYIDEARYVFRTGTVSNDWTYYYRDLKNLANVIATAKNDKAVNMQAAALTFQTFIAQKATDTWRDIPFSDAIKGDSGYLTPKYDKQENIYPALIANLKTAGDLFATNAIDKLGEGDLIYNGDITKWQKFCNSLRLRLAIRISNVAPDAAKANIEEILGNQSKYPVFESNDDNAFLVWPGTDPYIEPWAADYQGRDDHAVSEPLVTTLISLADPRLPVYAKPATADGAYRGVEIGPPGQVTLAQYSRIGTAFRENATGFTPYMRYAEVEFIIAEAAAKGWNAGATAQDAYEAGVKASLAENGITNPAAVNTYLGGSNVAWNGDVKKIYLQKWIALFKDGHEAWAESRRTDVPLLPAARGSAYAGHNRAPFRYPYPTEETTLNGANSGESIAKVKDYFWGQQMWWDTRGGVQ
ncbi:SusD/RagB family nutrient-binding outer membrane lipoprotein [Deminuibacter soli]|uniref:SusD/RagB family nutrient-binding outer membrane lipoprotein n=1 Tax=Deminuibacter soli TaxID=2291815 RepID=A0A3E1NDP9_9BACT|nr:SusD/RagB family nutrient-binding outer membrane lipoprotein [Deminuibacter soli]RFM25992.1 SusD/RagB family nutrient-binding outer membrane lipoprotein [Deminuibacter soli]